jgi:hypothetical protein
MTTIEGHYHPLLAPVVPGSAANDRLDRLSSALEVLGVGNLEAPPSPTLTALLNAAATVRVWGLSPWGSSTRRAHQRHVIFISRHDEVAAPDALLESGRYHPPSSPVRQSKAVFVITVDRDMLEDISRGGLGIFPEALDEAVVIFKAGGNPEQEWPSANVSSFLCRLSITLAALQGAWKRANPPLRITFVNAEAVPRAFVTAEGCGTMIAILCQTPLFGAPPAPLQWPPPHFESVQDVAVYVASRLPANFAGREIASLTLEEYERKVGTRQFLLETEPSYSAQ